MGQLKRGEKRTLFVGIDFGDSNRRAVFQTQFDDQTYPIEIYAPIIDQIEAIELSPDQFNSEKSRLAGMHEVQRELSKSLVDFKPYQLYKFANCKQVNGLKVIFLFKLLTHSKDLLKLPPVQFVIKKIVSTMLFKHVRFETN